ncbi:unnamed protein product [Arabidopsis thaliana]|uniref:(thale cress) hypothetical protein n=1 Tax=Arabidopsis thaliana TaxID=3702 RepID=A0A5S9YEA6_ARATH|nr:unnamed protein product [Arabidopsis thaliana]CAD5334812.1 unnamed protein product [Arabidopsis thaliana]
MSLLFNLVANLSVEEEESDHKAARFFSSSPKQTPYMVLVGDKVGESPEAENIIMSFKLFDLSKEEIIEVIHKSFPKLLYQDSRVIGSSRGWIAFMSKHDGTVHLSDVFNLGSLRVITLPPLPDPMYDPSRVIINVSLSYPPDQEDDYVVYIKFLCSDIYLCRPNHHSQWVGCDGNEIHTTASDIVYSPRNQMLFLVIMGASFLCSFDLNMNKKYTRLHLRNIPMMPQSEWELLAMCIKIEHLVESPGGRIFVVKQYVETYDQGDKEVIFNKTKRFMVFKLNTKATDGEIAAYYTEDIGDLCIFFGNNETLCLEASKYPGLKPNYIYYIGYGLGFYDMSSQKVHHFTSSMPLNWPLYLLPGLI